MEKRFKVLTNSIGFKNHTGCGFRVQVEELERQIADERKNFQVVAERLAEQQIEADKYAQQMQDDWDGKIRELQKEKYALSIRLQVRFRQNQYSVIAEVQVNNMYELESELFLFKTCPHEVMNHM